MEIYRRFRSALGESYPITIKLNSEDFLENGLTIEDSAEIAKALSQEGIDAIEISGGMGEVDMISMSRPLIREPDIVNKWKQGDLKRVDCISCNGCLKNRDEPVRCIMLD